jgi:hypothetical protein
MKQLGDIGKYYSENTSHLLYDRIPECRRLTPSVILAPGTQGGAHHERE